MTRKTADPTVLEDIDVRITKVDCPNCSTPMPAVLAGHFMCPGCKHRQPVPREVYEEAKRDAEEKRYEWLYTC